MLTVLNLTAGQLTVAGARIPRGRTHTMDDRRLLGQPELAKTLIDLIEANKVSLSRNGQLLTYGQIRGLVTDTEGVLVASIGVTDREGMTNPMTTLGDLIIGGVDGTPQRLPIGAEGEVQRVVGGTLVYTPLPTIPVPTGAPDGHVLTTANGEYVLSAPASGGVDTSLQAAPDTGWTAGGGFAAFMFGIATFSNTELTSSARLHRPLPACSPHGPMIEVSCRCIVDVMQGTMSQGIAITNGDFTRGVKIFINGSDYWASYNTSGTWVDATFASSGGPSDWQAGTVWLRIVFGPAHVHLFYGIGATRPTSWTRVDSFPLGQASPNFAEALASGLTDFALFTTRSGGSGPDQCAAFSVQWRSLLGAPA